MQNWAVLGTGFITETMIRAIGESDESVVHTLVGRNQDTLLDIQSRHKIERVSDDFNIVINTPAIDVVYIGLPNHVHHTFSIAAAKAGKAVLCEKSLTTTMVDAAALADAVRANGCFFVEGLMYLSHPLYQTFVSLLSDGRLGPLKAVQGFYAADIWQVTNPAGKGTLFNLGCYPASLLHLVVQTLCGAEAFSHRTVQAHGNLSSKDGTLVDAAVAVRFDNGVLATLQSTDSYGMDHGFTVFGENGALRFVTNPWLPEAGANRIQWCPYGGPVEEICVNSPHDAFYYQVKMVEDALKNDHVEAKRPAPRLQDSLEIMDFLTEWEAACLA